MYTKQAVTKTGRDVDKYEEQRVRRRINARSGDVQVEKSIKEGELKDLPSLDAEPVKKVHPWMLGGKPFKYVEGGVLFDAGDGVMKYPLLNLDDRFTGTGVLRSVVEEGDRPMPLNWSDKNFVRSACLPLVGEAVNKVDLDHRYLLPRALANLKTMVRPWPGVEADIVEFLLSGEFADGVVNHYKQKHSVFGKFQQAKLWKTASNLGATAGDVRLSQEFLEWYQKWWNGYNVALIYWISCWSHLDLLLNVVVTSYVIYSQSWSWLEAVVGYWIIWIWYYRPRMIVLRLVEGALEAANRVNYGSLISISDTCSKGVELPPLLQQNKNWKYELRECSDHKCKEKKPYDSYGSIIQGANMVIPRGCAHDQYNGARIRYFFDREVDYGYVREFIEFSKNFCKDHFKGGAWIDYSEDEWLNHLPGKRARLLQEAIPFKAFQEYVPTDFFVKMEAYLGKTPRAFKPRLIMGRRVEYQKIVGPYFYSLGKWLGTVLTGDNVYDNGSIDALELGNLAASFFGRGDVYEMDVSNWDGSLLPQEVEFEKWFVENCAPVSCPRWEDISKNWSKNSGVGKNGVSFATTHGRRSGDCWTSSFNTLLNILLARFVVKDLVAIVAKGDDNFISVTDIDATQVVTNYARLGRTVKLKMAPSVDQLGYCSGTFYPVEKGWKWGVLPFRVMAKLGLNLHRHGPKQHQRLLKGTAISMLPIAGHVPFVGDLLRSVIRNDVRALSPDQQEWKTSSVQVDDISDIAYNYAASRYGLSIEDVALLQRYCSVNLKTGRPLSIEDFPIVFEDQLFQRCFQIDAGCQGEDVDVSHIVYSSPSASTREEVPWLEFYNAFLAPPLEETIKWYFGFLGALFFVFVEGWFFGLSNALLHALLYITMEKCGYAWAILFHLLWNVRVFVTRNYPGVKMWDYIDYGSLSILCRRLDSSRLESKVAALLSAMHDCLATLINRITCNRPTGYRIGVSVDQLKKCIKNKNMRKKNKKSVNSTARAPAVPAGSLGRSLLRSGAGLLGGLFGPVGSSVADKGAMWLSDVLGMGDYEVKSNSLMNAQSGVPSFSESKHSVRVRHREYLGDITGSIGFTSRSYYINPGLFSTFPWLSNLGYAFQQWRMHGLLFEFVSTSANALNSTNTALGTVIMATNYNASRPAFSNKAEMEQYEFACSAPPSKSLVHPIECDPSESPLDHLYVRTGAVPAGDSQQFYDLGQFQIATVGMQAAATIGELWVTYDVEMFKPRIQPGGAYPGDFTRIAGGPYVAAANVLGVIQPSPVGPLGCTISSVSAGWDSIFFPPTITAGRFYVSVEWTGTAAANIVLAAPTLSNLTLQSGFDQGTVGNLNVPTGGTSNSTRAQLTCVVTCNGYNAAGSTITYSSGMFLPGSPAFVTIYVIALPLTDAYV